MTRATRRSIVLSWVAAITIVTGLTASAIERRPLPAFALTTTGDQVVTSESLVLSGKWLLVVVRPGCASCDTFLQTVDVQAQPNLPARMVVVVAGADATAAAVYAQRFPDLAQARWFADQPRGAARALKVTGTPVVFGLRAGRLEWSLVGVVPDAESVRSALVSWAGDIP